MPELLYKLLKDCSFDASKHLSCRPPFSCLAASVRMPPLGGKEAFPRLTQSIRTGRRRHSDDPSEAFLSDLRFEISFSRFAL